MSRTPTRRPRQYTGHVPPLANGVVSVTAEHAYGGIDTVTFPLAFRLYKPRRRRRQPGAVYKSTPQWAVALMQELAAQGLPFSVVLADSLYGASDDFISALPRLGLQ